MTSKELAAKLASAMLLAVFNATPVFIFKVGTVSTVIGTCPDVPYVRASMYVLNAIVTF